MAIDFSFPEELRFLVDRVRRFCDAVVRPAEAEIAERADDRETLVRGVIRMRKAAREQGLWLPHMPAEYGEPANDQQFDRFLRPKPQNQPSKKSAAENRQTSRLFRQPQPCSDISARNNRPVTA